MIKKWVKSFSAAIFSVLVSVISAWSLPRVFGVELSLKDSIVPSGLDPVFFIILVSFWLCIIILVLNKVFRGFLLFLYNLVKSLDPSKRKSFFIL
ncbi:MAG: hypothetical protein GY754_21585 [bacterium]|nr:hypothetical protein [bacterium]